MEEDNNAAIRDLGHEPFDAQASARTIIDNARSIQSLLKQYEENTRKFQEEVTGFVQREEVEENRFRELSMTVAHSEMSSLQKGDYIKYTQGHRIRDIDDENILPTSRMRSNTTTTKADLNEVQWASKSACLDWAPTSCVSLKGYGDVREVLLGWRQANSAISSDFEDMANYLYSESSNSALTCFFNGRLFCPSVLKHGDMQNELASRFATQSAKTPREDLVVEAAETYSDFLSDRCALTKQQFHTELWKKEPFTQSSSSFVPQLLGDVHDNIVLVDSRRLYNTHTFRGFFISGHLIAIEHIGPQVDIMRKMCFLSAGSAGSEDVLNIEKHRIERTFQMLYERLDQTTTNSKGVAMIAAIRCEELDADVRPHNQGVLLDVRPIAPSLPFEWHLSWGEICALGQSMHSSPSGPTPLFKVTEVRVSELQPYNDVSKLFFSKLNGEINMAMQGKQNTNATITQQHGQRNNMEGVSGLAFGKTATAVAAGALAALWLLKRK